MAKEQEEEPVTLGPRGGTTTVTRSGMVKKNLWVPLDEAELLRQKAFEERRSEADIIREGLGLMLYPWRRRRRPGKKGGATGGPSG
ncbi:MAG TPA: hypothetical protein VHM02_03820 [Thermoanaerobaculia bacterium]|nr:hypothetical protein [Thermoanaerobaculia bacterium]